MGTMRIFRLRIRLRTKNFFQTLENSSEQTLLITDP